MNVLHKKQTHYNKYCKKAEDLIYPALEAKKDEYQRCGMAAEEQIFGDGDVSIKYPCQRVDKVYHAFRRV